MRTKAIKKADAIFVSDIHLREDTPTCFIGDFQEEQLNSLIFISDIQRVHDCPVLNAGDLFHHWKPSPYLLSLAIKHLPDNFHTIYGQHDLPQHNFELRQKSGIKTLEEAGVAIFLKRGNWGQTPDKPTITIEDRKILVWHHLTYQKKPFPGATGGNALMLLKRYPQFDVILTGDNHTPFVEEHKGRILVNPGSLTRQSASQAQHKPRVYLWYADTNKAVPVYLPIKADVISREHIEKTEERDARIDAFISQLDGDWEIALSFEENLKQFEKRNKIKPPVMEIIYKAIGA